MSLIESNRNHTRTYTISLLILLLDLNLWLIKVHLHVDVSLLLVFVLITDAKSAESKHRQDTIEHLRINIIVARVAAVGGRRVATIVTLVGLAWRMGMEMAGAKALPVKNREACVLHHDVPALLVALGEDGVVLGDPLEHVSEEARGGHGSHHQLGTEPGKKGI